VPTGNSNNSYAANGTIVGRFKGVKQALLTSASTIVLVHEIPFGSRISYIRPYVGGSTVGANPDKYYEWLPAEPPIGTVDQVHFGEGGNLLFVDGHVKYRNVANIQAAEFGLRNVVGGSDIGPNPSGIGASADRGF